METINTIGRRKTSVARIYMTPGNGKITVNNKSIEVYFPFELHQIVVKQPLTLVGVDGTYDLQINVDGGGITGQPVRRSRKRGSQFLTGLAGERL